VRPSLQELRSPRSISCAQTTPIASGLRCCMRLARRHNPEKTVIGISLGFNCASGTRYLWALLLYRPPQDQWACVLTNGVTHGRRWALQGSQGFKFPGRTRSVANDRQSFEALKLLALEGRPSSSPVQSRTLIFNRGHRWQFLSRTQASRPFLCNKLRPRVNGDEIAKEDLGCNSCDCCGCSLFSQRLPWGVSIPRGNPGPPLRVNPMGKRAKHE
jgi:hypothetical protein